MRRPLCLFCIALIIGIIFSNYFSSFFIICLSISFILIAISAFQRKISKINFYILIGVVLFYSLGAFQVYYFNNIKINELSDYTDKPVEIHGYVYSLPEIKDDKVIYRISTQWIKNKGESHKIKSIILLTTLKDKNLKIIDYGSQVIVKGKLNIPRGQTNPMGFDYRKYLAQNGISATVFARYYNISIEEGINENILVKTGFLIRERIVNVIKASLPQQQAGLLNGMLIGYRKDLSDEVEKAFSDAGLTHIMAVSGANIAFIVSPLVFLFKKLKIKRLFANLIIIFILILFVFVTGFEPSVLRAVIMGIVILAGQIIRRDTDIYTSISFAAILLLVMNPLNLFNIGFQLSFGATLSLVLFYKNIKNKISIKYLPKFLSDTIAATLAAQVGVLPITVYFFNKVSVISIISNIIVVPITELITIIGSLMAVLGQINILFSQVLGYINLVFLSFVLYVTKITSEIPFATIQLTTPSILLIIIYYIGVLFFLWYKPAKRVAIQKEYYFAVIALLILIISIRLVLPGNLEVVFLDVGQGDSALIKTERGKTVLIDGGGYESNTDSQQNSIGDTLIIPFLLDYGVTKIDLVVATHGHEDHIQGLIPVIRDLNVKNIILPSVLDKSEFNPVIELAGKKKINLTFCKKNDKISLDKNTYFDIIHPTEDFDNEEYNTNNGSLTMRLIYKNTGILFTGDIEKEAEEMILNEGIDVSADVIKIAHHGSDTSSTMEFLKSVNPSSSIISVGENNNFGHPSKVTLENLEKLGIKIFRTDENGAILLRSNGKKIRLYSTVN